jgi:hypothetical protein
VGPSLDRSLSSRLVSQHEHFVICRVVMMLVTIFAAAA